MATISLGIATTSPNGGLSTERLVAVADEALYRAKQQGRNRVVCATGLGVAP